VPRVWVLGFLFGFALRFVALLCAVYVRLHLVLYPAGGPFLPSLSVNLGNLRAACFAPRGMGCGFWVRLRFELRSLCAMYVRLQRVWGVSLVLLRVFILCTERRKKRPASWKQNVV
jgi:hypothetical protein